MQLLELTQAEVAFLSTAAAPDDALHTALTRKLAATLTARLRLPVQLVLHPSGVPADQPGVPVWQPDTALATLWLTRRLGGQRVSGTASFVPPSLLQTLDATLAECWLDRPWPAIPPAALAWTLTTARTQAMLAVQLPHTTTDMTRWARGVIRHG
jgi:hypothetical protein